MREATRRKAHHSSLAAKNPVGDALHRGLNRNWNTRLRWEVTLHRPQWAVLPEVSSPILTTIWITVVQISEKPEGVSFSPWEKVARRSASPAGRSIKKRGPEEGQD